MDLDNEEQLETLLAICDYALYGMEPSLKGAPKAIFTIAKPIIDSNSKRRKDGKKGGRPPKGTDGSESENQWFPELKPNENENVNETETVNETVEVGAPRAPTPVKPVRKKYGRYGWVKLTDEEYSRLSNDLGETELKRCIAYVDESAQSTGNKNKWRDWNLVLRRCHRDRWGLGTAVGKPNARPVPSDEDYLKDWGNI